MIQLFPHFGLSLREQRFCYQNAGNPEAGQPQVEQREAQERVDPDRMAAQGAAERMDGARGRGVGAQGMEGQAGAQGTQREERAQAERGLQGPRGGAGAAGDAGGERPKTEQEIKKEEAEKQAKQDAEKLKDRLMGPESPLKDFLNRDISKDELPKALANIDLKVGGLMQQMGMAINVEYEEGGKNKTKIKNITVEPIDPSSLMGFGKMFNQVMGSIKQLKAQVALSMGINAVSEKKTPGKDVAESVKKSMNTIFGTTYDEMAKNILGIQAPSPSTTPSAALNTPGAISAESPNKTKNEAIANCDALKDKKGEWVEATAVPQGEEGAKYRELANGTLYKKGSDGKVTKLDPARGEFVDALQGMQIADEQVKKEVTALLASDDPKGWIDIGTDKGGVDGYSYGQGLDGSIYRRGADNKRQELKDGVWKEVGEGLSTRGKELSQKLTGKQNPTAWSKLSGENEDWRFRQSNGKIYANQVGAPELNVLILTQDGKWEDVANGVPADADKKIVRELYASDDLAKGFDRSDGWHYQLNKDGKIVASQKNEAMNVTEYKIYNLVLNDASKSKWNSVDKATAKV